MSRELPQTELQRIIDDRVRDLASTPLDRTREDLDRHVKKILNILYVMTGFNVLTFIGIASVLVFK